MYLSLIERLSLARLPSAVRVAPCKVHAFVLPNNASSFLHFVLTLLRRNSIHSQTAARARQERHCGSNRSSSRQSRGAGTLGRDPPSEGHRSAASTSKDSSPRRETSCGSGLC